MGVDDFIEDEDGRLEESLEIDDDGKVTLDKGNYEELTVLMLQGLEEHLNRIEERVENIEAKLEE